MTTPARNVAVSVFATGYEDNTSPYGNFHTNFGASYYMVLTRDVRPASTNIHGIDGVRPCGPWTHYGCNFLQSPGVSLSDYRPGTSVGGYWTRRWTGSICGFGTYPIPLLSSAANCQNRSLAKCLDALRNEDIHLGNFIGTIQDTVDLIANRANTIRHQVERFKSRYPKVWKWMQGGPSPKWSKKFRPRADSPCTRCTHRLSSLFLEMVYGWVPLLQDIRGAIYHVYNRGKSQTPVVQVKAYASERFDSQVAMNSYIPWWTVYHLFHDKVKVEHSLTYKLVDSWKQELSSLGLVDPREVAWERLRYSFVVDWFLPVSQYLANLHAASGMEFVSGGRSTLIKRTVGRTVATKTGIDQNVKSTYFNPPLLEGSAFYFDRTCFSASPVPGLYVKSPLKVIHALQAIALLGNAFGR